MADADHNTCSVQTCEKPREKRGWCGSHYARWYKTGSTFRACEVCGEDVPLPRRTSNFCSPACATCTVDGCSREHWGYGMCELHLNRLKRTGTTDARERMDPVCSVEGCTRETLAKGVCATHYNRLRVHGSLFVPCPSCGQANETGNKYCSSECAPTCSFSDCMRPTVANGLCATHNNHLTKYGAPREFTTVWNERRDSCIVCAGPIDGTFTSRVCCSAKCRSWYDLTSAEGFVKSRDCVICGAFIDLLEKLPSGRRRRQDLLKCDDCQRPNRYAWFKHRDRLLVRDNFTCGICDKLIDGDLSYPDLMSVSVDHILPRALGGTDDFENLQPAHLKCNCSKQARVDFKIA